MHIKDVLQRDPTTQLLVNNGQARIAETMEDPNVRLELQGELSTFVCEGQYSRGILTIIDDFLKNLSRTSQKAAWVSGFYGSGKSHLLKMLAHLWQNTEFDNSSTARTLVPAIPQEIVAVLKELDTAGKRYGGLHAAAGSLLGGKTDAVRLSILKILLQSVGLPGSYQSASFCLWLHGEGVLDQVRKKVEGAGKDWERELANLYVSKAIAQSVLEVHPRFGAAEADVRAALRSNFPMLGGDISTEDFLRTFRAALQLKGKNNKLPCTILILDEVQQYIADSVERVHTVIEVAEALAKQMNGQIMLVCAGQSALSGVPQLQRMLDRFMIRIQLSDADVENVTRKVLLQKKPGAVKQVRQVLEKCGGEVSRQLQGTRIGPTANDRNVIVEDYPLLPARRRFWEYCFRQVDSGGTQSQLRSQLRIIYDATRHIAERNLGTVIPGDELFDALAPEMVTTGILLREINENILKLDDGTAQGKLAQRVCGLIFLISKLPHESTADLGVRATNDHISDLLIDDLTADNGKLRSDVQETLQALVKSGIIIQVTDGEYRLQTKEGQEWDREYRDRYNRVTNSEADIQLRRDGFLSARIEKVVKSIKIFQGGAKESRDLVLYRDGAPPVQPRDAIAIWVRDEWSTAKKDVVQAAQIAGTSSGIVFVSIPRQSADDLRRLIVEAEAAQQTLDARGLPNNPEGQQAHQGMQTRCDLAIRQRDALVQQIVSNAEVFQGGGGQLFSLTVEERIREAATQALERVFPRFKEADAPSATTWGTVLKRIRDGADQAFQPVGYTGPTEQHPVCQQVLSTIGSGKSGSEVRKSLTATPLGWPQDAIDAGLIALHRSQHISATLNGAAVAAGQLDQNKISKTEFRVEKATLMGKDRFELRKLFAQVGITSKPGEEGLHAQEFLRSLSSLAANAGGEPPLPTPPSRVLIEDLSKAAGNQQLAEIRQNQASLEVNIQDWKKLGSLAGQRLPVWALAERLAQHAKGCPEAAAAIAQMDDISGHRMLLDETDRVSPLRASLASALRSEVQRARQAHEIAHTSGMVQLEANSVWLRIPPSDRDRILSEVALRAPIKKEDVSTDELLVRALDARPIAARTSEADAVAARVSRALEAAARLREPKVQKIKLESATLHDEQEVEQWTERQRKTLTAAVKNGAVFIQ
jgi:hypothetical protein